MNRIARWLVSRHVVAVCELYGEPEKRFQALMARCEVMHRVQFLVFLLPNFDAIIIAECRRQAGL